MAVVTEAQPTAETGLPTQKASALAREKEYWVAEMRCSTGQRSAVLRVVHYCDPAGAWRVDDTPYSSEEAALQRLGSLVHAGRATAGHVALLQLGALDRPDWIRRMAKEALPVGDSL